MTYKNAVPDNKFLKNNVELLSSRKYLNEFKDYIEKYTEFKEILKIK